LSPNGKYLFFTHVKERLQEDDQLRFVRHLGNEMQKTNKNI
jgi:hypothetical protein